MHKQQCFSLAHKFLFRLIGFLWKNKFFRFHRRWIGSLNERKQDSRRTCIHYKKNSALLLPTFRRRWILARLFKEPFHDTYEPFPHTPETIISSRNWINHLVTSNFQVQTATRILRGCAHVNYIQLCFTKVFQIYKTIHYVFVYLLPFRKGIVQQRSTTLV
jgi:hypothetical protein